MIHIESNKHIGILFQPRSGSHVLQHLLSKLSNRANIQEYFNFTVEPHEFGVVDGKYITTEKKLYSGIHLSESEIIDQADNRFTKIQQLTDINKFSVFKILIPSYVDAYPDISDMLTKRSDMQFIRINRKDMLYSFISVLLCRTDKLWHSSLGTELNAISVQHDVGGKILFPNELLTFFLERQVRCERHIRKYFGELPTIYYEEFEHRPLNILNKFSGIDKKIIAVPYNKIRGNYRELISNIYEIEGNFDKFINANAEYFPQYFENQII